MKNKYILISFILFLSLYATTVPVRAFDYYPETMTDPFYSSLNPTFVDKDGSVYHNDTTLLDLFNKKSDKKSSKSSVKVEKYDDDGNVIETSVKKKSESGFLLFGKNKNNTVDNGNTEVSSASSSDEKETKTTEKKHLTKQQLERELNKEEREKRKIKDREERLKQEEQAVEFKDYLVTPGAFFKKFRKSKNETDEVPVEINNNTELDADLLEYFPDKFEAHATGNAVLRFKLNGNAIKADKIVFNYDKNIIKADGNVVIISKDSITEGDYVKIDLNKPEGWIENPDTETEDIKVTSKEAYIYSDKIVEYDGVAKILKEDNVRFGSQSFGDYLTQRDIIHYGEMTKQDKPVNGVYKLKANTIIIDSQKDHEVITIKNADLYLKNHKIAKIPSIKLVSDKDHGSMETNIPEFGSVSKIGMYAGPGIVLNVPGGSTLKLVPMLTYSDSKLGIGAIARYRSETNMTEIAYGSSEQNLLIRGRQKLAPGFLFEYSKNTPENEWFLGYRQPKYSARLSYSRSDEVKDLGLVFSQNYSAGVFVDSDKEKFKDSEWRFRWMTQTYKPFFTYRSGEGNIGFNAGVAAQTSASVYTSGDVRGIARFGPVLNTKVGPWEQSFMYFQTAHAGSTPFDFDRYMYGHSNFVFLENIRISKYLTVGYLASLAMNRLEPSDDMFQENRALISIGPDYAKLTIGYDTIRHNMSFGISMLVGTKDSDIRFKKTVIKNPDTLKSHKTHKTKTKKKSKRQYLKQLEEFESEQSNAERTDV